MDLEGIASEIMDYVAGQIEDLSHAERLMVMGYAARHCNAYVDTILAREYHHALYAGGMHGGKEAE